MMGNSENNCFNQPLSTPGDTKCDLAWPIADKQVDFVGQFLQCYQKNGKKQGSCNIRVQQSTVSIVNSPQSSCSGQIERQNSEQSKPTKSIFHNFQKHLVTTLKMNITMNKVNNKNDPTVHLAQRMWKIFQQSNYFSKKILHFLFGVTSTSKIAKQHQGNKGVFQGFTEISSIYPTYEIQLAQEYLRQQVARQGKRLLSKNILSRRRMQKGEEFEEYFSKFLEQIENGAMSKRLPKSSKITLLNHLTVNKYQKM